jgi:phosphonate transport system ATP-binding protein
MAALIEVRGVSKRFSPGRLALDDVSLDFEAGQVTAILGPSGSGKSTLLRCINGLEQPTSGQISVDGLPVEKSRLREVRCRLGMVFQQHNLVPRLNALTNVLTGRLAQVPWFWSLFYLFPKHDVEIAAAALGRVGLSEQAWQRADKLSGGQQQRVAIARSIVQNPKGILADEPVASLDPVTSQEVLRILVQAARVDGLTLVINLHQVELAIAYCDRIVGLRQGRVAFDCPAAELGDERLRVLYDAVPVTP